ncbi:glycine oxidase ThiO [Actinomadura sp. KC06]|uniref:glycine oxidase ThiO n=1 Tax=Actinomadura sp. KC06 TaxID=2530369 RepID=UPI0010451948|nr:glycine oxidase ThiO [Actinomadura sp. KC06]TDD30913.1 glycine oxidase ThiO [Actinomadura sp. KC06]
MHVVIVGGGVIGLAAAWRALRAGLTATVIDPAPASKASHVSAGMLPPVTEQVHDRGPLLRFYLDSRDRYPSFVAELEDDAGRPAGYRRDGVLDAAFDGADLAELHRLRDFQISLGIRTETLAARDCLDLEPRLAPSVQGGLFAPDDGSVDPRRLTAALIGAVRRRGGDLVTDAVTGVVTAGGRATGVRLRSGGTVSGDRVVLAAGCWTHRLGGLPPGAVPEIRPVKGQILRLRSDLPFLTRTTRGVVAGTSVYLVPRLDGELVIGATYEDVGDDTAVTAGGVQDLLGRATAVLPGATALEFAEASTGQRPAAPDGLPVLGETAVPGLLLCTGHFRIGVQLTPATADALVALLTTGELPESAEPFSPSRFATATA